MKVFHQLHRRRDSSGSYVRHRDILWNLLSETANKRLVQLFFIFAFTRLLPRGLIIFPFLKQERKENKNKKRQEETGDHNTFPFGFKGDYR